MGPPEAGTKAYKTYLEKQRDRRRGVRKAGKTASLAKDAGALVSAAVLDTARRWSKDFDEQVRLKNQKLRENKGLLNRNGLLEEQRDQLKEALKSERAKNKQLTDQLADSTKEQDARMKFVEKKEKGIVFGDGQVWKDIEADEVDLRKIEDAAITGDKKKPVMREQWGGVVERGCSSSLVLTRLLPKFTKSRAPGPGPIRKVDWTPFAVKRLKGRNVILHTDGARAYAMKIDGVIHDKVIHKKKLMEIKGKQVWVKPKFTKVFNHTLPGGKKIKVKGGTQIIDRFWSHLRTHLGKRSSPPGSRALRRRIRSAQWTYWYKKTDQWIQTGNMFDQMTMW